MLDVALIAGTAVTQILLPYVKDGAVKFVETIAKAKGDTMGQYAGDLAVKVWDKVTSAFSSEKEQAVLEQFQEEPEAAAPLVEAKLQKKLEQDSQLAQELAKLIQSTAPDGSTGAQIIGSSYVGLLDMRGAQISGGGTFTGGTFNFGSQPHSASVEDPPSSSVEQPRYTMPQPPTKHDKSNG